MEAQTLNKLSISDYIKLEQGADCKYEYHDGSVYAMAGGTLNHGLICGNIFGEIRSKLKNKSKNCKAINGEIKLHIQSINSFLYPDAMIICGDIKTAEKEPNAVANPQVIIEVLSKSTASYDRGDKFFFYRQIHSLQEYILIEQDKPQIEIYKKIDGLWEITRVTGMDKNIELEVVDIKIALADIYEDIKF